MTRGWYLYGYDGSGIPLRCLVQRNADGTFTPLFDVEALPRVAAELADNPHADAFTPEDEPTDNEPISDGLWR